MKNFIKNASKILMLLLIIPIMSLSLVACNKNDNPDVPPSPPEQNQSQEKDDNPNSPIKSGIYSFEKTLSLEDKFFINEEKVVSHFKTQDLNGVNKKILELGYLEFAQNITQVNNLPKCIEFNSKNEVTTYKNDNNVYTSLDSFTYTYDDKTTTFKTSDSLLPTISYDTENNDVYLLYPFTYVENTKTVVSPLYIKAKLVYTCESFESMTNEESSSLFTYKAESMEIVTSSQKTDLTAVNTKLAEIFKIEVSEDTNVENEVETIISNYKLSINNDFTIVVLHKNIDGILTFTFSSISNNSFNVGSTNIKLSVQDYSLETTEISAYININEEAIIQFTIEKA